LQRFNTFPATINGGEKTNLELARDVGAAEAGHLKREMAWQWIYPLVMTNIAIENHNL
jgi:hypothetical protein